MLLRSIAPLLALLVSLPMLPACECAAPDRARRDVGGGDEDTGETVVDSGGRDTGPIDPCNDGLDGDRDGRVDEGCPCEAGEIQHCFAGDPALAGVGACLWGQQACASDFESGTWDECMGAGAPETEVCDGVDNDCDGTIDEGCSCRPGETRLCYSGDPAMAGVGICVSGIETCVASGTGADFGACEDEILPATEACDGAFDEDCDGRVDEGCSCTTGSVRPCYGGSAGSRGIGLCRDGSQTCSAGGWSTCSGETRPRTEACSGGLDEDCDGLSDCADPDCEASCCEAWDETVPVVPTEGEILFVIDRSGSMDWPAVGTTRTRWQELLDATSSVLPMIDAIPMGLLTFPRLTGDTERMNCTVAAAPEIGIAVGTASSISTRLIAADPRAGDTPTPQAIMTARSYLAATPSAREQFIILATDGVPEPACGSTVPATVAAIADVRSSLGIDTFVLGIVGPDLSGDVSGIPAFQAALNQFADAGGRPRAGTTRYYEASDGAELTTAFRAILAAATDCSFELRSAPPRPAELEVRLNGVLIPASSWSVTGTRLDLYGSACDQVQAGLVMTLRATDTCG